MSDSEDDYMSDKFLDSLKDKTEDINPGLLFNRTAKRQHEIYKQNEELKAKRPKSMKELEAEQREKGLNTALGSDNKGFKLLEKMGFKPGEALGKSKTGLIEPIKIEVKQGTSGVGRESHIKEKINMALNKKQMKFSEALDTFKNVTKEKTLQRFLQKDFYKAQKVCEDLDTRQDMQEPLELFYWTKNTMKAQRQIDEENEDEVFAFEEEFNDCINENNLSIVIDYLRSRHFYCMYCGFVANDIDDLEISCPGPYRGDHDDI